MNRPATTDDYARRLKRVVDHVHANLDAPLDLAALAEIACFSPYHFHRIYRAQMGETVAETMARGRLHRASMELARSTAPIADIARRAGYASTAAFTRAFSAAYGRPPAQFRAARAAPSTGAESMDVEIKDRPPLRIAAVRHKGPPNRIGEAFDRLVAWAGPRGLRLPQASGVAVYLSDMSATPADEYEALAGITVGPEIVGDETVRIHEVAGGRHAQVLFKGPYAKLPEAFDAIYRWLPTSGEEPADRPMFEVNLNDPRTTPPEELLTEVCVPLK
jgi:AraC family transcriptional regulator